MNSIFRILIVLFLFSIVTFSQTLDDKINNIISTMTLQEKILQLHQEGGFNTADNIRLKIPGFIMADGPHGVRDGLATCFPVGVSMAATWDTDLIYKVGMAMGKEFKGKGKYQALGPCMDLTKDPRNGRSSESGGEDPFLDAQITTSLIKGIQSTGIIATAKHFNLDSRQDGRLTNNYTVSKRNLMEHLGLNYRTAVQEGGVLSVMNAYNLVNGEKCAENSELLTNILRNYWGFPFFVVSDWGSIWTVKNAILAGCNVEMGSTLYERDLYNLVINGEVPESVINDAVKKVLRTKFASGMMNYYPPGNPDDINSLENQQIAFIAAKESMILLKNIENILPLNKNGNTKIALIGPSANVAQLDGGGSAYVTPFYSISPQQGIESKIGASRVLYAKGCDINSSNTSGYAEALNIAAQADFVIFVGGLDASQEGEGYDRNGGSISLPANQQNLINQLAAVNNKIIVVLNSGGICAIQNCINNIKGLVYSFYPGQEGGNALADVLFGDYNPAGRLPETMPINDAQMPARNFDFNDDFGCGYRWYDQLNFVPQFAFGFGLSYTNFQYSNLSVTPTNAPIGSRITVTCDVTNIGSKDGEEVVQLYIQHTGNSLPMPIKQLKGFKRIPILAGETKPVQFEITSEELYYYNESANSYQVEPGLYTVKIGGSSDSLPLIGNFLLQQADPKPDLRVTWIKTVPANPVVGDTVLFLAGLKNQGTGPSPEGVTHKVVFKINGQEVSSSLEMNNSLLAGSMRMVCSNTGLPWVAPIQGQFNIQAIVDPDNIISENLEDNNISNSVFNVYPTPSINLALNRTVITSSVEDTNLTGSKAVDGNRGTRWSSLFTDPQFIQIDLGSIVHFNNVKIYWETAYAKDYSIQVSNNASSWTTMASITNSDGGLDMINKPTDARYVKLIGTRRATEWGYSIYEFEVYNNADSLTDTGIIKQIPTDYLLEQNYPNPFNPSTTIAYFLPENSFVNLSIYDVLGRKITTLSNTIESKGYGKKQFTGNGLSSGIYFCKLSARSIDGGKNAQKVIKLLLLK